MAAAPAAFGSDDASQALAAFSREGPFAGMPVPNDVTVTRQVLAEPDAGLTERTWATLADGTPVKPAFQLLQERVKDYTPEWAAGVEPGWQQRRIENFQILTAGGQADEDLVSDAWTSITRKLPVMAGPKDAELADFAKMDEIRSRIDDLVVDRATAEALKPWYGYFCKRPCFHDAYLQTFNRENVTLVDTRGLGVQRIEPGGVVVADTRYELDCLIFATGFEVGTEYRRRTGFEVIGRDGITLTDNWSDGVRTFQGLTVRGFPNCFVESIAQAGFTVNFPYLLDSQARQVAWIVAQALQRGLTEVEPTAAAEAAWVEEVVRRSEGTAERARSCTPGYYNREGQANAITRQGSFFFGTPTEYADILENWRSQGDFDGLLG